VWKNHWWLIGHFADLAGCREGVTAEGEEVKKTGIVDWNGCLNYYK